MNEIKYIGFYDLPNSKIKRAAALSAINKMDYICDSINKAGYKVHLVSPSWLINSATQSNYIKKSETKIKEHIKLTLAPSFPTANKYLGYIKIFYSLIWLFFWLIFNVKRNEKILVYHSPWLSLPIRWAKKIKDFNIILEVEEIYHKVWFVKKILKNWEQKLIESADSYIVVSDVLAEILGPKAKAVVYGNYSLPLLDNSKPYFWNDKINVVYAGSIDDTRGGAYKAVECAALLPANYLMHISGQGDEKTQKRIMAGILKVNSDVGREACVYHGLIDEDLFTTFLQSCQIAINPQFSGQKFRYLFPSKIIKYMANNLWVVSTKIESIEKSKVSDLVIFTDGDQPEHFVKAILNLKIEELNLCRREINHLNMEFVKAMKHLLLTS